MQTVRAVNGGTQAPVLFRVAILHMCSNALSCFPPGLVTCRNLTKCKQISNHRTLKNLCLSLWSKLVTHAVTSKIHYSAVSPPPGCQLGRWIQQQLYHKKLPWQLRVLHCKLLLTEANIIQVCASIK